MWSIINGGVTIKYSVEVVTLDSWHRRVHQSARLVKEKLVLETTSARRDLWTATGENVESRMIPPHRRLRKSAAGGVTDGVLKIEGRSDSLSWLLLLATFGPLPYYTIISSFWATLKPLLTLLAVFKVLATLEGDTSLKSLLMVKNAYTFGEIFSECHQIDISSCWEQSICITVYHMLPACRPLLFLFPFPLLLSFPN